MADEKKKARRPRGTESVHKRGDIRRIKKSCSPKAKVVKKRDQLLDMISEINGCRLMLKALTQAFRQGADKHMKSGWILSLLIEIHDDMKKSIQKLEKFARVEKSVTVSKSGSIAERRVERES
jgi:hypothetical protein